MTTARLAIIFFALYVINVSHARVITNLDLNDACKEGVDLKFRGFNDTEVTDLLSKKILDKYVSDMQPIADLQVRGAYCGGGYSPYCNYGILMPVIDTVKSLLFSVLMVVNYLTYDLVGSLLGGPLLGGPGMGGPGMTGPKPGYFDDYSYAQIYSPQSYTPPSYYQPSYGNGPPAYGVPNYGSNYYGYGGGYEYYPSTSYGYNGPYSNNYNYGAYTPYSYAAAKGGNSRGPNPNTGPSSPVPSSSGPNPGPNPGPQNPSGLHSHSVHPIHNAHAARFRKFKRRELIKTCDRIEFPKEFDPSKEESVSEFLQKVSIRTNIQLPKNFLQHVRDIVKTPVAKNVDRTSELEMPTEFTIEEDLPSQVPDVARLEFENSEPSVEQA